MNVLVTGGAGYIGSVVCTELVRSGHRVIVLEAIVSSAWEWHRRNPHGYPEERR